MGIIFGLKPLKISYKDLIILFLYRTIDDKFGCTGPV